MPLPSDLISQFAKITKDAPDRSKIERTVFGTIVKHNGTTYVRLDGSDLLTPVTTTVEAEAGERVSVLLKNHTATVTGNITSPSVRTETVKIVVDSVTNVEKVLADTVSADDLLATNARVTELEANDVTINDRLVAQEAEIEKLSTDSISAEIIRSTYATIESLNATDAVVETLKTEKLSAKDIEGKYANIDFSNISKATMELFYANSGLIKDVTIGDTTITGELVGVTISGDRIKANTLVADKLVIRGTDGLYYALNTNGVTTEAEQTDENSLNGQVIMAKSITASKISVEDLVAFGATIGGFKLTASSLYSGVKSSVGNTTRGIYLDNDGQMAIGDADNFIKYYKDTDGSYKLAISANSMILSTSNKSVEQEINDLRDELTTLLRIESSRGTVFKNNNVSTVLTAVIYHGNKCITDVDTLKATFGSGAYLQWSWQRLDDESYGTISVDDSRVGNGGFTLTLGPEDVDTKVTFKCELVV